MSKLINQKIEEKVKKSYLSLIFSRVSVIILLISIQIFYFLKIFTVFGDYVYIFLGGSGLISFVMIIYLMNNRQNPMVKLSWSILVLIAPIFTTFLYLYIKLDLGNRKIKKNLAKNNKKIDQDISILNELKIENKEMYNLAKYVKEISSYNIHRAYNIDYFPSGEDKFESMLNDLRLAKEFIFMEYFIIDKGYMWDSILNILIEKVKEGVEVRVMYDGTCALSMLPYNYPEVLKKYGIKAKMFSPIKPFLSTHYNNRDHRKILVIDGKIAYTGGINLGDEYINKIERFGHWKDTAIKFDGPAVDDMTLMFLKMYNANENKIENFDKYLKKYEINRESKGYIMPYGDYPVDDYLLAEGVYLNIINGAKDYVYIMTPYMVIDNELIQALKLAAMKGVDVKIILPHIPDKEIPFAIAHTYYDELIESGVKIYEYKKGFVHAKMFLRDNEIAVVGTINLDYRSLYHNFECAALMYKTCIIENIKNDFDSTILKSILINKSHIKNDKLIRKILGKILKIIAPLL